MKRMKTLHEKLSKYSQSDYYGFHMPGHKRVLGECGNPYEIDITEIDGFDDLHHPEENGILNRAQERAARLYGSEETHFLINGSTAGILSAISACTRRGGRILAARDCHRSVYHGIALQNLDVTYIYPQLVPKLGINGSILPEDVEKVLEKYPDVQAVVLTSPTYDGICSDVKRISEIAHGKKIPVIVDQAHGAHFPFHEKFPQDAIRLGADVVIHSVHKTLPSLTQTALLHVNGNLVDRERLRMFLGVYQTSSPSYILMASIDQCMEFLETRGKEPFDRQLDLLEQFYEECVGLKRLILMNESVRDGRTVWDMDVSKLLCFTIGTSWSGKQLGKYLLEKFHIQMEMNTCSYSLGISTVADTKEGFERLREALYSLDLQLRDDIVRTQEYSSTRLPRPVAGCSIGIALDLPKEQVERSECLGRMAGSFVYLYPPGIPLLAPGEVITEEVLDRMAFWDARGMEIHGLGEQGTVCVLRDKK